MTPLGDRVLVERIDDTDGKERTLESGLVLPARDLTLKHGRADRIPDTFSARVLAASKQANEVGVRAGDEVLVHTYDQRPDKTLVGEETAHGLFVRIDDILGVVEKSNPLVDLWQREINGVRARVNRRLAVHDLGLDENDNIAPLAVESLGFYRRGAAK